MPAFSIDIAADLKAQMGEFLSAARDMEREYNDIQRRITRDLKEGRNAKPEDVERATLLQEKRDYYLAQERSRRNPSAEELSARLGRDIEEEGTRDAVTRSIYRGAARQEFNADVARLNLREARRRNDFYADWDDARQENAKRTMNRLIEEIQESRTPGGIKTIASLLNTHNPHGSIRAIMQGRISGAMVQNIGESLEAQGEASGSEMLMKFGGQVAAAGAAVAPIALLAYLGGKAVVAGLEEHEANNLAAQQAQLVMASNSFEIAHKMKHDPSAQMTDFLISRQKEIAASNADIAASQPTWGWKDLGLGLLSPALLAAKGVSSFLDGGKHEANMKQQAQTLRDMTGLGSDLRAVKGIDQQINFRNYMEHRDVLDKFSWKDSAANGGLFGYIWSNTAGRITGSRQREQEEYAMELTTRRIKGLAAELKKQHDEYEADPHNRLNDRERDHHLRVVEESHIKHFQNWNPI